MASPKTDALRAMRERAFGARQKRSLALPPAKPEAKAAPVAKVKALANSKVANALANTNSTTYTHRDVDARRAYQRDLMRKRRVEAKAAT